MTHRFYLPTSAVQGEQVLFPQDVSRQITRVLRLRPGAEVIVFCGDGSEIKVTLSVLDAAQTVGAVLEKSNNLAEPKAQVTLFIGLTQREKFEWVLQKCTEVGVSSFVPLISERSLVQSAREFENKQQRWERILLEAAEQSGRGIVPGLTAPLSFADGLDRLGGLELGLFAWEEESRHNLDEALAGNVTARQIGLMVGPEGGFSPQEARQAQTGGWQPVSLGKRILRMETAAVVASALVIDYFDRMTAHPNR